MWGRRSIVRPAAAQRARAFTLIELLVVFTVMVILISAILVGGPRLIDKARTRTTESLLGVVDSAIEEFKRQQTQIPTLVAAKQPAKAGGWVRYAARYGAYPPDELEVFTKKGLPGSAKTSTYSLAVGGGSVFPGMSSASGEYDEMKFYTDGDADPRLEHRDLAAMILAIEMYSPSAMVFLDRIPASQRSAGAVDAVSGEPSQFLDRDGDDEWTPEEDLQIRYIVDLWGVPISYLAQRDCDPANPCTGRSSNHPDWNKASTEMIRLNDGRPILMSYGPDGKDQLKQGIQDADLTANLVGDWAGDEDRPGINNLFNKDNVYANPDLAEKLFSVVPQE